MGDVEKPKSKTEDLADRVTKSAAEDGDVSSFQKEINSLSKSEQLQFVRDLSTDSFNNNFLEDGKRVYVDANTKNETGNLVDLDLVIEDRGETGKEKSKRVDLLTPGESGEAFDKAQKIDQTLRPYVNLFGVMNEYNYLSERYNPQLSKSFGEGESYQESIDRNKGEVRALLERNLEGNPDREAILKAFETPWERKQDKGYSPVNSTDSMLARLSDNPEMPANVAAMFKTYFQRVEELRLLEPDRDDEFKRY